MGSDGGRPTLRLSLSAVPREVRSALMDLRAALAADLDEECLATVETVLAEVLNNIAEHAYRDLGGPVSLLMQRDAAGLRFRVLDRGQPMPRGALPEGNPPTDVDPLPEGGFGWFLIRRLTTELEYRREPDGNLLLFCIPVKQ